MKLKFYLVAILAAATAQIAPLTYAQEVDGSDIDKQLTEREGRINKLTLEEQLKEIGFADDLARGRNIMFCATGISDSSLLPGIRYQNRRVVTHSVLMRARFKTIRYITTHHDLGTKTLRRRSDGLEHPL